MARSPEPATSTRVVLVRHAVTAQTGPLLSGRAPGIDLSADGRAQAERTAERLAVLPVAAVYSSPLERTMQTAELIAKHHGRDVVIEPGVLEADYGDWTGGEIKELVKTDLWKVVQRSPSRASFPGGESIATMQARIVAAIEAIAARHPGEVVVVVSHADPIKAAVAQFTGLHLDQFQRLVISPASVTVLELTDVGATLLCSNDSGALDALVAPPPAPPESEATP